MSSAASPIPKPGLHQMIRRAVDWRLVAAIGLPVWAFLIGAFVMRMPAPPRPTPQLNEVTALPGLTEQPQVPPAPPEPLFQAPVAAPAALWEVVRTEVVSGAAATPAPGEPISATALAAAVPAAVPAAPVEFNLPPSEVVPGDRCKTFDTKIRFHPDLAAATEAAKQSKKMLLVLHISGNFDDPGFT